MKSIYITAGTLLCSFLAFCSMQGQVGPFSVSQQKKQFLEKKNVLGILPTERQKAYDVKWYFLNLEVENNSPDVKGNVTIRAQVEWPQLTTFSFHLHNAYLIDSLKVNGMKCAHVNYLHERLVPNLHLLEGEMFEVQVFYRINQPSTESKFSGIKTAVPTFEFRTTWTLSEPNSAYEWFPVKQDLTDKADSAWVFVTTADTNKVGSNGNLGALVYLPDNKVRYEWKSQYPIDYYLISMAISDYREYSILAAIPQTQEYVFVQNFIYNTPEYLDENKKNIDMTAEMITLFSELFGPYPFRKEKYGHATAPISGGMEHQTMTTISEFSPFLVAHELAHQWFGNNVTCASWEYIWLNEGLASYGEQLWNEHVLGKPAAFSQFYSNEIFPLTFLAKSGSVYVPKDQTNNASRIFHQVLTYSKGACLVHMLRYELNDDIQFFKILQTYQERFTGRSATLDDFKGVVAEISGKDFTVFFDQWFYGEGYPIFDFVYTHSNGQLTIESDQITTNPKTPLFVTPFDIQINYSDKTVDQVRLFQDANKCNFTYQYPSGKSITSISFDPNHWLLAKANTYYYPTGIPENNILPLKLSVYPNPTDDLINVRMDESLAGTKKIWLMDVSGKTILHRTIQANELRLDVSRFKSGIYHLGVSCNGQSYIGKVIKR